VFVLQPLCVASCWPCVRNRTAFRSHCASHFVIVSTYSNRVQHRTPTPSLLCVAACEFNSTVPASLFTSSSGFCIGRHSCVLIRFIGSAADHTPFPLLLLFVSASQSSK